MATFTLMHVRPDIDSRVWGFIPGWFTLADQRPSREIIDAGYKFAGGWHPWPGFELRDVATVGRAHLVSTKYPDDLPERELTRAEVVTVTAQGAERRETLILFQHAWVAIVQADGSWEVARVD